MAQGAKIFIYVDSLVLAKAKSISVDRSTNSQPMVTIMGGYEGETPGAAMTEISVSNAVLVEGFEFNPSDAMKQLTENQFDIKVGDNVFLSFTGNIISDSIQYAANSELEFSFKARGKFAEYTS